MQIVRALVNSTSGIRQVKVFADGVATNRGSFVGPEPALENSDILAE